MSLPLRRLSVAPMLDWTDRHYRFFARQLTHHAWLYSEMVHTGAILYGNAQRFLAFDTQEHPLALQLGGSVPEELARCCVLAEEYGYDEVNLNCGCPSPKVQKGSFGACLMLQSDLVADCLKAMQDVCSIDITLKHRIGIDQQQEYAFVRDFIGQMVHKTQCKTYIVHARNAILAGLSPKENREVPPLKYEYVYHLKKDFPDLEIILNGGVTDADQISMHLVHVDGVMIGREAYHNPYIMADWDRLFYQDDHLVLSREEIVTRLIGYCQQQLDAGRGTTMRHMARHYLGLMQGMSGAKKWRQILSDATQLAGADSKLLLYALEQMMLSVR